MKDVYKKISSRKKLVSRLNHKNIRKAFVISINEIEFLSEKSKDHLKCYSALNGEKKILLKVEETKNTAKKKTYKRSIKFSDLLKFETKKIFRKKRKINGENSDNEMWSFCSKRSSTLSCSDFHDVVHQKKVFWKTSKLPFPLSLSEQTEDSIPNQNMIWRSLQHLQKFCEEKYINIQQISEVLSQELQKIAENNSIQMTSDRLLNKHQEGVPVKRKTRLSRWTFLGHDNNGLKIKSSPIKSELIHYSEQNKNFQTVFLKVENASDVSHCLENSKNDKRSLRDEYCNCSCEKCADDPKENSTRETKKLLRELNMAPNSEEDSQNTFSNKRGWEVEFADKEPLRPPVYNPEDYATSLKKWGKKGCMEVQLPQYLSQSTGSLEKFSEELSQRSKKQSFPSTKSSSSIKSGDEKQSKKEKESTLKVEKKDMKNKENINRGLKNDAQKDFLHPILNMSAQTGEMSLRQFSSVTELLGKLKMDLKLSFPSFVQEFVGDPIDGVTLLLELLRAVQLSQTSQPQKCPPQVLRRALLDEHSCLVCLKHCLRCSDASRRLASSPAGLFTLAVCIMSNVTQSRIIALELLTKACEPQANGHKAVSEALSTLRLRFGEPVRFRFLVGMLSSAGARELLATAMKFINVFLESAPNLQQKVYIQAELEQAGFDSKILRKTLPTNSESVKAELNKWERNYFDVEKLQNTVAEVNILQEKIQLLEKRIKILQEEKEILQSLEQCLKERCSELEEEVSIKTITTAKISPTKPFRNLQKNRKNTEKGESTPAEDEGISSSEQELSQDEDYIKHEIPYKNSNEFEQITNFTKNKTAKQKGCEVNKYLSNTSSGCNGKNMKIIRSNKMKETNVDDGNEIIPLYGENEEEEETTIDEVIEELENIVNDAETEAYKKEEKVNDLNGMTFGESQKEFVAEERNQTCLRQSFVCQEKNNFDETEIVPAILHPQPPKKAKSLVHIYFPGSDFDSQDRNKSEFFEDDSGSESSDSLLTTTREKKPLRINSHKSLEVSDSFNSFSSVNTRSLFIKQEQEFEDSEINPAPYYEERNIDEEEIKRQHLKKNLPAKKDNTQIGFFGTKQSQKSQTCEPRKSSNENLTKNNFSSNYERAGFYQVRNSRISNENAFPKSSKFVPTPVKRSQTFHITSSNEANLQKKNEIKPKPKMGVSGLDFQRATEQKMKNEHWKNQLLEQKKNLEGRTDVKDIYSEKSHKESGIIQGDEKGDQTVSLRRGSFNGSFSVVRINRCNNPPEFSFHNDSFSGLDRSLAAKSKSVEKMDEGLDSLVDIVISTDDTKNPKPRNEWNVEVTKNIGPRTRRSLAESSLFCPQYTKNFNKVEESPKPPKPAQRTSLARNNSSSIPLHLPTEIKLTPVQVKQQQQVIYNFGIKPSKSVDSLLAPSQAKRFPPDGSSSPTGFKKNQENRKTPEEKSPNHPNLVKPSKVQTFFGNPNFENTVADQAVNHKYFESNYAAVTNDKSVIPVTQNGQTVQNFKSQLKIISNGTKDSGINHNQEHSKPNFLLGTYQSQSSSFKPKISVLQSVNTFNNNCFINRNNAYSGTKKNNPTHNSYCTKERNSKILNSRLVNSNSSGSEKVTDSPSGLY